MTVQHCTLLDRLGCSNCFKSCQNKFVGGGCSTCCGWSSKCFTGNISSSIIKLLDVCSSTKLLQLCTSVGDVAFCTFCTIFVNVSNGSSTWYLNLADVSTKGMLGAPNRCNMLWICEYFTLGWSNIIKSALVPQRTIGSSYTKINLKYKTYMCRLLFCSCHLMNNGLCRFKRQGIAHGHSYQKARTILYVLSWKNKKIFFCVPWYDNFAVVVSYIVSVVYPFSRELWCFVWISTPSSPSLQKN